MKFNSYASVFIVKINEIHISINEKSNRDFFKYPGIEPGPKSNRDPVIPDRFWIEKIKPYQKDNTCTKRQKIQVLVEIIKYQIVAKDQIFTFLIKVYGKKYVGFSYPASSTVQNIWKGRRWDGVHNGRYKM